MLRLSGESHSRERERRARCAPSGRRSSHGRCSSAVQRMGNSSSGWGSSSSSSAPSAHGASLRKLLQGQVRFGEETGRVPYWADSGFGGVVGLGEVAVAAATAVGGSDCGGCIPDGTKASVTTRMRASRGNSDLRGGWAAAR